MDKSNIQDSKIGLMLPNMTNLSEQNDNHIFNIDNTVNDANDSRQEIFNKDQSRNHIRA
jgi:hypothetical protein